MSAIIGQVLPFLSQEHQQQVATAVERAKQVELERPELTSSLTENIAGHDGRSQLLHRLLSWRRRSRRRPARHCPTDAAARPGPGWAGGQYRQPGERPPRPPRPPRAPTWSSRPPSGSAGSSARPQHPHLSLLLPPPGEQSSEKVNDINLRYFKLMMEKKTLFKKEILSASLIFLFYV